MAVEQTEEGGEPDLGLVLLNTRKENEEEYEYE